MAPREEVKHPNSAACDAIDIEVGDNLLLVLVHPSGEHRDEDVEDHGRASGWKP